MNSICNNQSSSTWGLLESCLALNPNESFNLHIRIQHCSDWGYFQNDESLRNISEVLRDDCENYSNDWFQNNYSGVDANEAISNLYLCYCPDGKARIFSPYILSVWTVIFSVLLAVGVGGNALVILVVAKMRDLRTSTNLLLVNLAGADLLVLLVPLPTALVELHSIPETWVLGKTMCMLVPFVEWSVSNASVFTILVISSERYYAICHPLKASYTCTKVKSLLWITFIWLAAFLVSSPNLFTTHYGFVKNIAYGQKLAPSCYNDMTRTFPRIYYTVMVTALFLLPLLILLILYILIAKRLTEDSNTLRYHRNAHSPSLKARKQVIVMLATVTLFFFVCLLPFRLFSLWIIYNPKDYREIGPNDAYSLLYATRLLLYVNSSINPILYSLTSSKFRAAFFRLLNPKPRYLSRNSTFTTGNFTRSLSTGLNLGETLALNSVGKTCHLSSIEKYDHHWSLTKIPEKQRKIQYRRQASFTSTTPNFALFKEEENSNTSEHLNNRKPPSMQVICNDPTTVVQE